MLALCALTAAAEEPGYERTPEHYLAVSTGVNLGLLQIDLVSEHFIASLCAAPGIVAITQGQYAVGEARIGYALALSPRDDSMWFFDAFFDVVAGRMQVGSGFPGGHTANEGLYGGVGLAVGFRYVHRSGLVLGFKLPLVGASFGEWVAGDDAGTNVLSYYLVHLFASSVFTVGLRF